jgi:hypothetical protein
MKAFASISTLLPQFLTYHARILPSSIGGEMNRIHYSHRITANVMVSTAYGSTTSIKNKLLSGTSHRLACETLGTRRQSLRGEREQSLLGGASRRKCKFYRVMGAVHIGYFRLRSPTPVNIVLACRLCAHPPHVGLRRLSVLQNMLQDYALTIGFSITRKALILLDYRPILIDFLTKI